MGWVDESIFRGAATFASAQVGGTVTVSAPGKSKGTALEGFLTLNGLSCSTLQIEAETLAGRHEIRLAH